MKAIIHIGMPKTGSTSIQTWLKLNHDLLRREGVRTFQGKVSRLSYWHAIFKVLVHEMKVDEKTAWPWKMTDLKWVDENYRFLNAEHEKLSGRNGIFAYSREQLYKCSEIHIVALDKFLSKFFDDITYIVYIRDMVDFMVSRYSETLRSNNHEHGKMNFQAFWKLCLNNTELALRQSRFHEHLLVWDKVLEGRINVRLLESDWLVNGDLIEDFAAILSVDAYCRPSRMNESFSAEYIEYVRFLNCDDEKALPIECRRRVLEILTAASAGKPKLAASDTQAIQFHEIYREQEERIRNKFFPDRPFLFSPKSRGDGIMPMPLTDRRKIEVEGELGRNLTPTTQ